MAKRPQSQPLATAPSMAATPQTERAKAAIRTGPRSAVLPDSAGRHKYKDTGNSSNMGRLRNTIVPSKPGAARVCIRGAKTVLPALAGPCRRPWRYFAGAVRGQDAHDTDNTTMVEAGLGVSILAELALHRTHYRLALRPSSRRFAGPSPWAAGTGTACPLPASISLTS